MGSIEDQVGTDLYINITNNYVLIDKDTMYLILYDILYNNIVLYFGGAQLSPIGHFETFHKTTFTKPETGGSFLIGEKQRKLSSSSYLVPPSLSTPPGNYKI